MDPRLQHFAEAYLAMAKEAHYRPQAPGDGMGNVYLSKEELVDPARLEREAIAYATAFAKEEDTPTARFWIGYSDWETSRAFVWAIEAARQFASGTDGRATAVKLLEMAVRELQVTPVTQVTEVTV